MSWPCSYCGADNPEDMDKCDVCGNYADWTINAILDRIGKAYRDDDMDRVLQECMLLKQTVKDRARSVLPW